LNASDGWTEKSKPEHKNKNITRFRARESTQLNNGTCNA
jgi:hypothetical protein